MFDVVSNISTEVKGRCTVQYIVFSLLILTLFLTLHITNTDVKTISTQLTASSQGSLYCLLYTEAMLLQEAKSSQICTFYFLRLTSFSSGGPIQKSFLLLHG